MKCFILISALVGFINAAAPLLSAQDIKFIENHESWNTLPADCGPGRSVNRIINGKVAIMGQFPWFVRLGRLIVPNEPIFGCGGSLITEDYVITAAHCLVGVKPPMKVARVGEPQTDGHDHKHFEDILIKTFFAHPYYNKLTLKHDIALIALEDKVKFTAFIKPICLPRGDILQMELVGQETIVAGWGITDSSTRVLADDLLYVNIPIRDLCLCTQIYQYKQVNRSQLCAGVFSGLDSCDGDSGGPLMKKMNIDGKRKTYLIGLVSFGLSYCGEAPAVYTNIVYYVKWILDTLKTLQEDPQKGRLSFPVSRDSPRTICKYSDFMHKWNFKFTGTLINSFANCE